MSSAAAPNRIELRLRLQNRSRRSASTLRSVSGIRREYRDGGGSNAAVVVTSHAIHLLGGSGYRHAVRDDAF
jgi:hypothetical protein